MVANSRTSDRSKTRTRPPIYFSVLRLCEDHPENKKLLNGSGEPNQNELSRRTGIHQPTLQRILSGESKDPRDSTLKVLAEFFKVSLSQLKGEESLYGHKSQVTLLKQASEQENGNAFISKNEILALIEPLAEAIGYKLIPNIEK